MDKNYSKEDFKLIVDFLKLPKSEAQKIQNLIDENNFEEAAGLLSDKLKKYLKEFQSLENYKLKTIDSDLAELDKAESVLESDFDTEFENFYQDRYEAIDKKLDQEYQKDSQKMDEIDEKVKEAINRMFETIDSENEQKRIMEIRKNIGGNNEE